MVLGAVVWGERRRGGAPGEAAAASGEEGHHPEAGGRARAGPDAGSWARLLFRLRESPAVPQPPPL